jgi:hypothetical protein
MKTRLLTTLALLSMIVMGFASTANAGQKPIPGIKKTPEYRALNRYVNFLGTKKTVPATDNQKTTYRVKLRAKRTATNVKAKSLYNRRVIRISKRDDDKQRRVIRKIRHNQKVRVGNLNAALNVRLGKLNAKQANAVNQINANYAFRINPLVDKRSKLQKKLAKAKSPARRAAITAKINNVQARINRLVNARQADANAVVDRYNSRARSVKSIYAKRINNVRKGARHEINQAKRAYKRLYKADLRAAKQRKDAQISLITGLAARGTGYINQMPPIS